jgi:hypothetical protein
MPAQTPGLALPYPLGSDKVQQGDDDIRALAERIEARLPWGALAYAQSITSQSVGVVFSNLNDLTATVTVPAGRRLRISGLIVAIARTGPGTLLLAAREGGAVLGSAKATGQLNTRALMVLSTIITPAAGPHTYVLTLQTDANTADTEVAAGQQSFILVEDIGPAAATSRPAPEPPPDQLTPHADREGSDDDDRTD